MGIQIFTSYFARVPQLPANILPVSIALYTPPWLPNLARYPRLAPKREHLQNFKLYQDQSLYIAQYVTDILLPLNLFHVIQELTTLANGAEKVCLLCYEKTGDFCHRNIFRQYYNDQMDAIVDPISEYTYH